MYEVIGMERLNYKSKSGKQVQGYRVYFTYDLYSASGNRGRGCDAVFLNDDVFTASGVDVGSPAMPVYNKYGRCTGFVESV